MLAPVIEELANEVGADVKVCKLDVDSAGSIAENFGIKSIPTVIIFKDGRITEKFVESGTRRIIFRLLKNKVF